MAPIQHHSDAHVRRLIDRIAALEAVIERLPMTADGVRVVPTIDTVWRCVGGEWIGARVVDGRFVEAGLDVACGGEEVCKCYSTLQAARAAAKGGE